MFTGHREPFPGRPGCDPTCLPASPPPLHQALHGGAQLALVFPMFFQLCGMG